MPFFELLGVDEYGTTYATWATDDLEDARDMLHKLEEAEDELTGRQSWAIRYHIQDLREQIYDYRQDHNIED